MKTKKTIKLQKLEVVSFVTEIAEKGHVRGGATGALVCGTAATICTRRC